MSQHIFKIQSIHEDRFYVRLIQESFTVRRPFEEHLSIVFESLREFLWLLSRHLGTVELSPAILKAFLKLFLQGFNFLYSECHIIHTDKYAAKYS